MLASGIKVAWFSLSLSGLLGSFAALPAFAQALDGYLIPVLYLFLNFVLQGIFCLGMIWNMDPFSMPRAFCTAQPALLGLSWTAMTSLTTYISVTTSLPILRPWGGMPACPTSIRGFRAWHPACLLLALIPAAAFVAYLALSLRFNAVQPTDGMNCDVTTPSAVWIRVFSYAGVPLLLALPSFLMTGAAAFKFYAHSPRHSRSFSHSNDLFTPVPLRRQSKSKPNHHWQEAKSFDEPPQQNLMPELIHIPSGHSADNRSLTPSGTIVAEAIPTPPESLSSASARARMAAGRAPVSPGAFKHGMRYHLPFQWQWQPPSPRGSTDRASSRHTPSPLVFATPREEHGQGHGPHTATVAVAPDPDAPEQRIYDAAPWLREEKALVRQAERALPARRERGRAPSGRSRERETDGMMTHAGDDDEDDVSGSLRWIRGADDNDIDNDGATVKSELEFVRPPARDLVFEGAARRPSPVNVSTYDAGLTEPPIPNARKQVWRVLLFAFLAAVSQILATVSPLIDIAGRHAQPVPLGTQHVALLLVAWAPLVVFGVRMSDFRAACHAR